MENQDIVYSEMNIKRKDSKGFTYEIAREGIFQMQICTNNPNEGEISRFVFANFVSGTSAGWQLDRDYDPVVCGHDPTFKHYIFSC